MSLTAQKMAAMQEQAAELLEKRPSVFRTGFLVLLLRLITGLLALGYPSAHLGFHERLIVLAVPAGMSFLAILCLYSFTRPCLVVTGKYRNLTLDVQGFGKENLKEFVGVLEARMRG